MDFDLRLVNFGRSFGNLRRDLIIELGGGGGSLVLMVRDVCMSLFLYRIIGTITTHH